MVRLIKRYESRKLYDTEESRYVSLDEIADWVRSDQEVRVIDNATSEDVTAQTLTQVILDEGRNGHSLPPSCCMTSYGSAPARSRPAWSRPSRASISSFAVPSTG